MEKPNFESIETTKQSADRMVMPEETIKNLEKMQEKGIKRAEVEYEPYEEEGAKKIKVGLEDAKIGDGEVIFSAIAKKEGEEKETVEVGKVIIKICDLRGIEEIE